MATKTHELDHLGVTQGTPPANLGAVFVKEIDYGEDEDVQRVTSYQEGDDKGGIDLTNCLCIPLVFIGGAI